MVSSSQQAHIGSHPRLAQMFISAPNIHTNSILCWCYGSSVSFSSVRRSIPIPTPPRRILVVHTHAITRSCFTYTSERWYHAILPYYNTFSTWLSMYFIHVHIHKHSYLHSFSSQHRIQSSKITPTVKIVSGLVSSTSTSGLWTTGEVRKIVFCNVATRS